MTSQNMLDYLSENFSQFFVKKGLRLFYKDLPVFIEEDSPACRYRLVLKKDDFPLRKIFKFKAYNKAHFVSQVLELIQWIITENENYEEDYQDYILDNMKLKEKDLVLKEILASCLFPATLEAGHRLKIDLSKVEDKNLFIEKIIMAINKIT